MAFEATLKYYADGTVSNVNTNFDEELISRYYYKDGYVFATLAQTDEEYEEEIAYINENFDEAVEAPFYASETNAFRQIFVGIDGYTSIYTCTSAIVWAIALGVVGLLLIGLSTACFILRKKTDA